MKTDICTLNKNDESLRSIICEVNKCAEYNKLDKKQMLRLQLLAEELVGMLPNLLDFCNGEFYAESTGKKFELHVNLTANELDPDVRQSLLDVSTTGKNAVKTGIMEKIKIAVECMFYGTDEATPYVFFNMGMCEEPLYYTHVWSLDNYMTTVENAHQHGEQEELWDELEKSIIARLADDVTVGIKGRQVEIVVKKAF